MPLVWVMNSPRNPISPRAGTKNSSRVFPLLRHHVLHFAPPPAQVFDHHADKFLGNIDDHVLDRFAEDVGDPLVDDLGPGDLEFVSFTSHRFDQDGEVQAPPVR